MSSVENLAAFPTDLILQILSRLPAKSIARCRCVSKLWASLLTLDSPYFTVLFLTQSKTRPRLLFTVFREKSEWCLYSSPQPQISSTDSTSSISVTAEFHMSLGETSWTLHISNPISGLMYFSSFTDLDRPILCNPSTGHLFSLPQLTKTIRSFFGYDPINNQFKVLAFSHPSPPYSNFSSRYQILKLEPGRLSWRNIECPLHHHPHPRDLNICIDGILYYIAKFDSVISHKITCFDLNSEEFKFIDEPWYGTGPECFVNFKGKLGVIVAFTNETRVHLHVDLWVLEDIKNQEWSKRVYDIHQQPEMRSEDGMTTTFYVVGMTTTCDIVLTVLYATNPFYVLFFNLEKKTLQEVEIKGLEGFKNHRFYTCVDHIEELRALKWS